MVRKLLFLHEKNKLGIRNLRKEDIIIYLDNFAGEKKGKNSINFYLNKVSNKAKQNMLGYKVGWTQQWALKKNIGNKSFAEKLIFEGKSLWYPIEFFLHYDGNILSHDPALARILIYIACVKTIIKEKKPHKIIIENDKSLFNKLVKHICEQEKIRVSNLGMKCEKTSFSARIINNSLVARTYIKTRILLRRTIGKLFCKKMKPESVLILTSDRLSNKENITDYYWGPIIKDLNRQNIKYKMVEYDRIDVLNSLEQVKKRYLPQKYDAQFIGTYYDNSTIRNMKKMISFLRKKFRELDKRKDFRESFNYKGIRFYDLIRPRLKKIFLTYSHYIADVYAISKSIIEREKPKIILVDHEKNYYGRALITEANFKKIPSFAFEGELVYENNTYLIQVPIKEILDKQSHLWRPIPEKKLVWGGYTRRWYEKKNYFPREKLKIIGAPKYDYLKGLNEKDKKEIRRKYGVGSDEKLITIITTPLPWEKEYLSMVFKSLRDINRLRVIIKMHPNEPVQNKKMIEQMIKKFQINGVVISNENSSRLIHSSDLITTYWSTLVYECILLNKRIVLVDLSANSALAQPYVKEGLIKPCTNFSEVNNEIRNCLFKNKKMSNPLRKKFIKKYLYSNDGKASERAVNYIRKIVSQAF